jgi:hypothetical protein
MATEKTVKPVNYTPEQTAAMVAAYIANPTKETVDTLAVEYSKTSRSIIAKLSREGVYKAKEYATKVGEPVIKKDAAADELAALVGLTEAEADSLTKANKTALIKLRDHIVTLQAAFDAVDAMEDTPE